MICTSPNCLSQSSSLSFKKFTTKDGLPHDVGFDILEASNGYLWIGTDDGLTRFDGFEFKNFNEKDGLKNPFVIALAENHDGSLLAGTNGGGLHSMYPNGDSLNYIVSSYNEKVINVITFPDGEILLDVGLVGSSRFIYKTSDTSSFSRIWWFLDEDQPWFIFDQTGVTSKNRRQFYLNQTDTGLYLVPFKKQQKQQFQVFSHCKTSNNKIWLSTNYGFFEFPINDFSSLKSELIETEYEVGKVKKLPVFAFPKKDETIPDEAFYSMVEDNKGNLWLGGNGKIVCRSSNDHQLTTYTKNLPKENILRLAVKDDGSIFFATGLKIIAGQKNDLYHYNTNNNKITRLNELLDLKSSISMLEVDQRDNFWFTTHGDGLYCIFSTKIENYSVSDGLSNSNVLDILQTKDGRIWAGTQSGLNIFKNNRWHSNQWLQSADFTHGLQTNGTQVFSSISDFNKKINKRLKIVSLFEKDPPKIIYDHQGQEYSIIDYRNLWENRKRMNLGRHEVWDSQFQSVEEVLESPLIKFSGLFSRFSKAHKKANFAVNGDSLLIGVHSEGLYFFHEDSVSLLNEKEGLLDTRINDLKLDDQGRIWLATEGGIYLLKKNTLTKYGVKEGLLTNKCRALFFDHKGVLWVATPKGLHYWGKENFKVINSSQGLIDDNVHCIFEDDEHKLWVGTSQGISVFENDTQLFSEQAPVLVLEKIVLDGERIDLEKSWNIQSKSQMSIHYTCIAFLAPENISFQYRLNPNESWTFTKNRSITLRNLVEDEYLFEIRAKKLNSEWTSPIQFAFTVHPPWWQSKVFWIFAGLIGGLIISFLILKLRRFIKKKEALEAKIKSELAGLELKALRAQMNPHFIFNALNAIMHFILNEDKIQANLYLSKFARLMRMYLDASKSSYITLADELELLQLYTELELLRFKDKFEFQLNIDQNISPDLIDLPSMLIQPFVENAINHGLAYKKERGKLLLEISMDKYKNELVCIIEDDGIGRNESAKIREKSSKNHKSHGTRIIEERLNILNNKEHHLVDIQTIDLRNNEGLSLGTRVVIGISLIF